MPIKKSATLKRREDLIVQKLGDEAIIYDRVSHRAHSLNRTASLVFEKLDGTTSLERVARDLKKTFGNAPEKELVAAAVNELAAADLLSPGAALPRRSVLRGLAAGLLPVVASIAVPSAASAASCGSTGDICIYGTFGACCPGYACTYAYAGVYTCVFNGV